MTINFNQLLYAISYALDCVEKELVGVTSGHAKRVAYLSVILGRKLGLSQNELVDLAACAVLHDNALTQYIKEEFDRGNIDINGEQNLTIHCAYGENNIKRFPFQTNVSGAILYHHERADGNGPYKKQPHEVPLLARLIHFADALDAGFPIKEITQDNYNKFVEFLETNTDTIFEKEHVRLMLEYFKCANDFILMNASSLKVLLEHEIPVVNYEYKSTDLKEVATVFAKIIDYKSKFTMEHSIGIAQKAQQMGAYYHYSAEMCDKLYMAGALHDIGKLAIHNEILEKPDKLTEDEYSYMQDHAWYTCEILKNIKGMEDICSWASNHHEKLNGKGYPAGKTAEELGKMERLFACLDIYQALVEKRPYKDGMSHVNAMNMLYKMAKDGYIDLEITRDIDYRFG